MQSEGSSADRVAVSGEEGKQTNKMMAPYVVFKLSHFLSKFSAFEGRWLPMKGLNNRVRTVLVVGDGSECDGHPNKG